MKTAIRSSTFWWTLAFLIVVIAPTRAFAAGAPTAAPTPAGPPYFITWFGTASDSIAWTESSGAPAGVLPFTKDDWEERASTSTQGSAVVRLNAQGDFVSERVITAADSHQYDEKDHRTYNPDVCVGGDYRHSHQSVVETNLPNWNRGNGSYPPFAMQTPTKRSDGTWVIRGVYPEWMDTCLSTEQFANCYIHRPPSISTGSCDNTLGMIGGAPGGTFDLEATDPEGDFFSKQINYQIPDGYLRPPGKSKLNVSWKITVRRIGKCLVGNSIPIEDDPDRPNKDINDEDIEMGVEYGKSSIDPDTGVAPINIRVTCDQVPIKNTTVNVKIEVQKNTGGHLHYASDRPNGTLNGLPEFTTFWGGWVEGAWQTPNWRFRTDDDGRVHLTFKPGKAMCCKFANNGECVKPDCPAIGIAGIYRITATPDPARFPGRKAEVAVEAKVGGLSRLDANTNYVDDISALGHTSGDNATVVTKQRLAQFASAFHDAQVEHDKQLTNTCLAPQWPIYPLWVIDISLPFGGLYDDIHRDWSTPTRLTAAAMEWISPFIPGFREKSFYFKHGPGKTLPLGCAAVSQSIRNSG